jgi:hypothetical protein
MATRHGRKLSYHMLLPLDYEGKLEQAATANGMSAARFAAHVITKHLDQLALSAVASDSQSPAQ